MDAAVLMPKMNDEEEESSYSDRLVFYVNGKRIVEENPDPSQSLLTYLREKLHLTGTKLGCGEGGCGACTVLISRFDRRQAKIRHHSATACITPLASLHGRAVTTVEGIGSVGRSGDGLHPVQERLSKAHGSQCGFCTPGFVMSMYALLRNNPSPTEAEIENAFQGNLCRCTGYRPILDGFKTFARDGCCGGMKNGRCCMETNGGEAAEEGVRTVLFELEGLKPYDPSQEVIFPSELQTDPSYDATPLHFRSAAQAWHRPVSLAQLLALKKARPDARLVVGNTELGVEANVHRARPAALICTADVPDLTRLEVSSDCAAVSIGASATLAAVDDFLRALKKTEPEHRLRPFAALLEMLHWFAGAQIRNVASMGGNVMTASPISDLNPLLIVSDATLIFVDTDHNTRRRKLNQSFFKGYRKVEVSEQEILLSIEIPFSTENTHIYGFKQAHRREDDISIVNAGMRVCLSATERGDVVEEFRAAFGGVAPITKIAQKCSELAKGRIWNAELCDALIATLNEEFVMPYGTPGGSELYRRSLVLSFFFRFFQTIQEERKAGAKLNGAADDVNSSAVGMIPRGLSRGSQLFDGVPSDQQSHDPVGRPLVHLSGMKQATGEAEYVDDMPTFQHGLYLAPVCSAKAHARILAVDPSAALAMDGVKGWVDHRDVPGTNWMSDDEEVFAEKEARFHGHIIGAVVATTKAQAQQAALRVAVTYEELPTVLTVEEAVAADSVFDGGRLQAEKGDLDEGWRRSDVVVEGEVRIGGQEHFYLETMANVVVPREDGGTEVYSSTQYPMHAQEVLGRVLGVPYSLVTVHVRRIGGGFGGKESQATPYTVVLAVAARKFGVPVRWMLDRNEDFLLTGKRHPCLLRYKIGSTKDGKFQAFEMTTHFNGGYSRDISCFVAMVGTLQCTLGYAFPSVRLKALVLRTNMASNTSFRAFGHPQCRFGVESAIIKLSAALGLPPEQVRANNMMAPGYVTPFGYAMETCNVAQCWTNCEQLSNFSQRRKEVDEFNRHSRWKKRGVAMLPITYGCSFEARDMNQGAALINIYRDGSVLLTHGGVEMGQGLHTKMIQVASRCLGIGVEWIHTTEVSTDKTPNTSSTAASFSTDLNGNAIINACAKLQRRLAPLRKKNPDLTWPELVMAAYSEPISLSATGYHMEPSVYIDKSTLQGVPFVYFAYGAGCTEVEIDCLTGDHVVKRVDLVMDVGKSINPAIDIGQVEGAFVQGYGLFMLEELRMSPSGVYYTNGPGNYKIPSFGDIPEVMNVHLLRDSANEHPRAVFSSRAVGEPPLLLSISVIAAVHDAIAAARRDAGRHGHVRLDSPATPERIRLACEDRLVDLVKETMPADTGRRWDIQQ